MNILKLKPLTIKTDENLKNNSNSLKILSNYLEKLTNNNLKIYFNIKNLSSNFEYQGIKIIYSDEPNEFIKDILNDNNSYSNIFINDNQIRNKDIFCINHFSKISDFINNKKNSILHDYLKEIDIFNNDLKLQEYLAKLFFDFKNQPLESLVDLDLENASILSFLSISNEYISKNNIDNLLKIIEKNATGKQLIILNDYHILSIQKIIDKYIDKFNFLIITNNLFKWIKDKNYLEFIVIINERINEIYNLDSLEIINKNIFLKYLEKNKKNEKEKINNYIKLLEIC